MEHVNLFNKYSPKRKMSESDITIPKRGRPRKIQTNTNTIQIEKKSIFKNKSSLIDTEQEQYNLIIQTINNSKHSNNSNNTFIKNVKNKDILDTEIILKNIDCANLDKKYGLKEIGDYGLRKLSKSNENIKLNHTFIQNDKIFNNKILDHNISNTNNNLKHTQSISSLTTILENLSLSKENLKPSDTINSENNTLNLYYSIYKENKKLDIRKTDICCYHCRHNFNMQPLSIPIKYYPKENKFDSDGVFCSFNCMLAYIHERNSFIYKDSGCHINLLYKMLYGVKNSKIIPAPSWKLLKNYGGTLSIEEFRKTFDTISFDNNPRLLKFDKKENLIILKPICNAFFEK
jgi:hypothetical protein